MALQGFLILSLIVLANLLAWRELSLTSTPSVLIAPSSATSFNRSSFPSGFVFGAGLSAYQCEGAVKEGGRGPSNWDTFTHEHPEKIFDRSNADVANDFYHRYKDDIKLMKFIGLDAFRFSISWSRVLPQGKLSKGVNNEGIMFYNNLINELISKGIQPFPTIFHWDVPQALEDECGGFLSPSIVDDFRDFADLCFKEFGDRVKHWLIVNEALAFSQGGYDLGDYAPGRCSTWISDNCTGGNSGTEPYLVTHHMILGHAYAVKLYREKYKASQKGQIGPVLVTNWMLPHSKSKADVRAAQRSLDFSYGWCLDPIIYGDYPKIMRTLVGSRLPKFTDEQAAMVKNSYDFLAINYYMINYVKNVPLTNSVNLSYTTDSQADLTVERLYSQTLGVPTGDIFPRGLYDLLIYTKKKYKNPIIYTTENGMIGINNGTTAQLIRDTERVDIVYRHLLGVKKAIKDGVRVKGYFARSFLDTWEWNAGFTVNFGINFVDFSNGLKRIPKLSALWFKNFLATN